MEEDIMEFLSWFECNKSDSMESVNMAIYEQYYDKYIEHLKEMN